MYSWHAHTKKQYFVETKPGSGEYVSLKDLKRATGNSTQANRDRKEIGGPTPSEHDYINATSRKTSLNFIMSKRSIDGIKGDVVPYNNQGQTILPKMSLKFFLNTKAKNKPVNKEE